VTVENSKLVTLNYGKSGRLRCEIDTDRIVALPIPPESHSDLSARVRSALAHPLDFPPLTQAVLPDDRVALTLDAATPEASALIAETWRELAQREVSPEHVVIVQPDSGLIGTLEDPRSGLSDDVRERVAWKLHDPSKRDACRYLGTSAGGERIYLASEVVEADLIVTIGWMSFDPILGYRGTNSVLYPGLSQSDSVNRAYGQGHQELHPNDDRPIRQMIDEIGWLLGTQFSIQVIPGQGTGVSHVLAGAAESVLRKGQELLSKNWFVELDSRPQIVVLAVDQDAGGHGWQQVGAALQTARNLVACGGSIIVLTELNEELGAGLDLVRKAMSPSDAIRPLRTLLPPDLLVATHLAAAADWAKVYFLSRLESDLVEELFLIPLEEHREIERLLADDQTCVFLNSAQHWYGRIGGE